MRVAINVHPVVAAPKPSICKTVLPVVKVNISSLKATVVPSDLIKTYLSSSNGKKDSFVPAANAAESWPNPVSGLSATSTLNSFLIVNDELVRSTSEINAFGINEYNLLSVDLSNGDVWSFKLEICVEDVGIAPLATPVTVVTPVTLTSFVLTVVILANDGKLLPNPPNDKIFPTFSEPGNKELSLVTVHTPVALSFAVNWALPKSMTGLCIMSPLNVFAAPTLPKSGPPYTDFTSCIPKDVIAVATRLLSVPFITKGSFVINSPVFS